MAWDAEDAHCSLTHRLDPCDVSFCTQQGEEEPDESRNKEDKPDPGIPVRKAGRPGRKRKQPVVSGSNPIMPGRVHCGVYGFSNLYYY